MKNRYRIKDRSKRKKNIFYIVLIMLIIGFNFQSIGINANSSPINSVFVGDYSDNPIDSDGDGLYDYFDVKVKVQITQTGSYCIYGKLYNQRNMYINYALNSSILNQGIVDVILRFNGTNIYSNRINESYKLKNLLLLDENNKEIDYREAPYNTIKIYNYTDFARPNIFFIQEFRDYGIDLDGDGDYDKLKITMDINATIEGRYLIVGDLVTEKILISSTYFYVNIIKGMNSIIINFDGQDIFHSNSNGPYLLKNLSIMEDPNESYIDRLNIEYVTSSYNYTDFDNPHARFINNINDYGIDVDRNGLFEFIIVEIYINITTANKYTLDGKLYTYQKKPIDNAIITKFLNIGESKVILAFNSANISLYLYSGTFLIENIGIYSINGDHLDTITTYISSFYNYTQFEIPSPQFTKNFNDYLSDKDNRDKSDTLSINVELNINQLNNYRLEGQLYDQNFNQITLASTRNELGVRIQTMTLEFNGIDIYQTGLTNTQFDLRNLRLYDDLDNLIIELDHAYTTRLYNYTDFEPPPIIFQKVTSDSFADTDNDGINETLAASCNLDVQTTGDYKILGYIYDSKNDHIATSKFNVNLQTGLQNLTLYFNGTKIYNHGLNGPYIITFIEAYNSDGNFSGSLRPDYMTQNYSYLAFKPVEVDKPDDGEIPPPPGKKPDLAITASDLNVTKTAEGINVKVTVHNLGQEKASLVLYNIYAGNPKTSGKEIGSNVIDQILAQMIITESLSINATNISNIYIWIDPDNKIIEINESNNIAHVVLDVVEDEDGGEEQPDQEDKDKSEEDSNIASDIKKSWQFIFIGLIVIIIIIITAFLIYKRKRSEEIEPEEDIFEEKPKIKKRKKETKKRSGRKGKSTGRSTGKKNKRSPKT